MYVARNLTHRFTYTIKEGVVEIEKRGLFSTMKTNVQIETLSNHPEVFTSSSKKLLTATILLAAVSGLVFAASITDEDTEPMAWIFYAGLSLIFGTWFLGTRRGYQVFESEGNNLYFPIRSTSGKAHIAFIEQINKAKLEFIQERAVSLWETIDESTALNYLQYLFSQQVIELKNLNLMIALIKEKSAPKTNSFGFAQAG